MLEEIMDINEIKKNINDDKKKIVNEGKKNSIGEITFIKA